MEKKNSLTLSDIITVFSSVEWLTDDIYKRYPLNKHLICRIQKKPTDYLKLSENKYFNYGIQMDSSITSLTQQPFFQASYVQTASLKR